MKKRLLRIKQVKKEEIFLISIIVPVYNVEQYIERCLQSLINQTLEEIEIIVVNDGSPDNSEKIIKKFMAGDSRIKYYKKENGGLSDARNFGIKKSQGEYIAFLDSDDYIEKEMYKKMLKKAEENNSEIVVCGFRSVYENGKIRKEKKYSSLSLKDILEHSFACNKIYKKSLFSKNNLKFPVGKHYEDLFLVPKLFTLAKNPSFVEGTLYNYVMRDGSITGKRDDNRMIDFLYACVDNREFILGLDEKNNVLKEWDNYSRDIKRKFYRFIDNYSVKYKVKHMGEIISCYKKLAIYDKLDYLRLLGSLLYPKYYVKKIYLELKSRNY